LEWTILNLKKLNKLCQTFEGECCAVLDNNKMMLLYGFDSDEKNILSTIVEKNELPSLRVMEKGMSQMKVRDIIEGFKFEVLEKEMPEAKVILFNNFTDDELEKAIKAIRYELAEQPILAVVTPTSIEWTLEALISHLIEEREWFRTHND
jgi:hypothetical protein